MATMYIIMIALHRAHELFVIYTFDHSVQNLLVSTLDISLANCYRGGSTVGLTSQPADSPSSLKDFPKFLYFLASYSLGAHETPACETANLTRYPFFSQALVEPLLSQ